jgi:hypothetical protein
LPVRNADAEIILQRRTGGQIPREWNLRSTAGSAVSILFTGKRNRFTGEFWMDFPLNRFRILLQRELKYLCEESAGP